jgi:hypothetical protein
MLKLSAVVEAEVGACRSLMAWKIKAYPHPILPMDIGMAALGIFFVGIFVCERFFYSEESTRHVMLLSGCIGLAITIFLWIAVVRQKTVYSYRFTESGCEVDYWLNSPRLDLSSSKASLSSSSSLSSP